MEKPSVLVSQFEPLDARFLTEELLFDISKMMPFLRHSSNRLKINLCLV